ncbi:fimbria/pilus outer membrane usher protein [Erwinia tasmaniensis]|uniref:fimbria/pilus outer membrane usher protein n=1 Tax=Erwinia tasmaniensis TaxID=338565 RepID=UPI003A4DC7A3
MEINIPPQGGILCNIIKMRKIILFLLLFPLVAVGAGQLNFDENLIKHEGITAQQIDDAINQSVPYSGINRVNIILNRWSEGQGEIFYREKERETGIDEKYFLKLELKKDAVKSRFSVNGKRYVVLTASVRMRYDRANNTLKLTVPGIFLQNPSGIKINRGGIGAIINYDLYSNSYKSGATHSRGLSNNYELGFNAENTIVRSHGYYSSYTSNSSSRSSNTLQDVYIDKNIMDHRVRTGRFSSPDTSFGSGYIDGAAISSGSGSGTAFVSFYYDSSEISTAEFWQNDQLIWKQRLNKGHNAFDNIPVLTATKDVTVRIMRNDRLMETRILSPAQIKTVNSAEVGYYFFAGRSLYDEREITLGAGANKSFNNILSPAISFVARHNYQGVSLSNSMIAKSFNTSTWLQTAQNEQHKLGINLTTSFDWQGTSLSFSQTTPNFTSPGQALRRYHASQKNSVGISQSVPISGLFSTSFSATRYSYYDQPGRNVLAFNVTTRIKKATINMGVNYSSSASKQSMNDKMNVSLNVSLPLFIGSRQVDIYSSAYHNANGTDFDNSMSTRVNDLYSVSAGSRKSIGDYRSTRNYIDNTFNTAYTHAMLDFSQGIQSNQRSEQLSAMFSGSIGINRSGIIFSPQKIKDTYAVVDTGLHHFVTIRSKTSSVQTNHDGKAIIPRLLEDREDYVQVDPKGLDSSVVIEQNRRDFISMRGSVTYLSFHARESKTLLLHWVDPPKEIKQYFDFYDKNGKFITNFIDRNILLVDQTWIETMKKEGMTTPANLHQTCKLITNLEKHNESIIDARFNCTK